jgi:fumarate reductase flavoprotein subunit
MVNESSDCAERLNADIVVLGGGGAGMAAALAAAENGASNIVVLEKRAATGGNSGTGGGPGAVGGPVQRRQGIQLSKDEYFKNAMSWSRWKTNPRVVRTLINESGDTIGWLEKQGVQFFPITMLPTYHIPVGEGREMMGLLRTRAEELGVRVLVRTGATRLVTDERGGIRGVEAESAEKKIVIDTGCVVIATGGYGSNGELLRRYCDSYRDGMEYHGIPNDGDGLLMATAAGAAVENAGTMLLEGPLVSTAVRLPIMRGEEETIRLPLVSFAWEPYLVWVNKYGRRFMAEDAGRAFEGGNAVARQPDNLCFVLFDGAICRTLSEQGFLRGRPLPDAPAEMQRGPLPGLDEALRLQAEKGTLHIAQSWAEMAKWIGCDGAALETTIAEYNDACAHNYDSLFCKDRENLLPLCTPPYYAIKCTSAFLDTIGGIKIDEEMQVLNSEGCSIPGLFAAGVITGGWETDTYFFHLLGSARGFALTSGRIAGANAAAYVGGSQSPSSRAT